MQMEAFFPIAHIYEHMQKQKQKLEPSARHITSQA